jgi:maltoporin
MNAAFIRFAYGFYEQFYSRNVQRNKTRPARNVRSRSGLISIALALCPLHAIAQTAPVAPASPPPTAPQQPTAAPVGPVVSPPTNSAPPATPPDFSQGPTDPEANTQAQTGAADAVAVAVDASAQPAASAPVASTTDAAATATRPPSWMDGFSFGSYGRVVIATDLRGHVGREANIVAHGTRVDDQTYTELEVHRDDNFEGGVRTRVVATLAIRGPLFHQSGTWDAQLAVRNLYIEARDVLTRGLALWVGSRMYRGDDIYLLNWWPMDNLNTVGAGGRYDLGNYLTFAVHGGTNRLDSSYQYQSIRVIPRDGIGAVNVALLDRPRFLGSLKTTLWLNGRDARRGVKLSLYGEGHTLPEGVRQQLETGERELLPSDGGYVVGAQVGAYTGQRNTYVNLFFRYAQGLASYGDLAVPYTLSAVQTSARARDVVLALAGNFEHGWFGLLAGAYLRYFRDADPALYGRNDQWEGTFVLRPTAWIGQHAGISVEGSWQRVTYNTLDMVSGQPKSGSAWRFAVIPFVTPAGRGSFTRPHLRAIYAATLRDDGALRLYAPDDPFARNSIEHYLALSCEWWFNSSYL